MRSYSVRDVERLLRLSPDTTRNLIRAGFVTPARGTRREYRFSFQDLIVLRAARALIDAQRSRANASAARSRVCARELPEADAARRGCRSRRGRRSRGGARWRDTAPGRQRSVSARSRHQPAERCAAGGRAPAACHRYRHGSCAGAGADDWFSHNDSPWKAPQPGRARSAPTAQLRGRRGPAPAPRRLDQLGTAAA